MLGMRSAMAVCAGLTYAMESEIYPRFVREGDSKIQPCCAESEPGKV